MSTVYVVAMKSGHAFHLRVEDFSSLVLQLQKGADLSFKNQFFAIDGAMFDIGNVSAIYPLSVRHDHEGDSDGR